MSLVTFCRTSRRCFGSAVLLISALSNAPSLHAFQREVYNPAILSLAYTETDVQGGDGSTSATAVLDLTLITRQADPVGKRVLLSKQRFAEELRALYRQISRLESLDVLDSASPARSLHDVLIAPIAPLLQQYKITTLLIAADRGLQGVPFAALHDGSTYFGERYAFSITPSVRFTSLGPPRRSQERLLAAGASRVQDLTPLPLVPQEIRGLTSRRSADQFLDKAFTPDVLLRQAADSRYDRVHIASHADFQPGGPSQALLYTGAGVVTLPQFLMMRDRRQNQPLELFSLSACRTALGDRDSELGFAGLALQAGSRSAIGTLWYVDDVATSAYFLQLYRYLDAGLPKAEALRATRLAMVSGRLRLRGDQLLGADDQPLLTGLDVVQRRRVMQGLTNPFFWAGIELFGTPW